MLFKYLCVFRDRLSRDIEFYDSILQKFAQFVVRTRFIPVYWHYFITSIILYSYIISVLPRIISVYSLLFTFVYKLIKNFVVNCNLKVNNFLYKNKVGTKGITVVS